MLQPSFGFFPEHVQFGGRHCGKRALLFGGLQFDQRESLDLVKSSADALLTVINDILDFSKIEAGKLDIDPELFSLRDEVGDTLKTMAIKAVELTDPWAVRDLTICVRDVSALPPYARQLVEHMRAA